MASSWRPSIHLLQADRLALEQYRNAVAHGVGELVVVRHERLVERLRQHGSITIGDPAGIGPEIVAAARATLARLGDIPPDDVDAPPWEVGGATESDDAVVITQNWDEIRRFMMNYVGIVRSDKRLERAKRRIASGYHEDITAWIDERSESEPINLTALHAFRGQDLFCL